MCEVCGKKIEVMCQQGTGYCSRDCEKKAGIGKVKPSVMYFASDHQPKAEPPRQKKPKKAS